MANLKEIEESCLELNTLRNDFIFLHVNCFGLSFLTAHELTEGYYKQLQEDIDTVLEIYAGLNKEYTVAVPFNLNRSSGSYVKLQDIDTENAAFGIAQKLAGKVVRTLEQVRESLDSNGYISMVDSMLEYWEKQYRFILGRFNA